MKTLTAISIAISVCATVLGIGQPASAWTLIAVTKNTSTPTYYDENNATRSGDVVIVRISANNQVGFLGLSCSRGLVATSVNGRNFDSPRQISPRSSAGELYQKFCH